jgi:hypothetical protein
MRSIISVSSIIEESAKPVVCAICNIQIPVVQSTVEVCKEGAVVSKVGICPEHGAMSFVCSVKSVLMLGDNISILGGSST